MPIIPVRVEEGVGALVGAVDASAVVVCLDVGGCTDGVFVVDVTVV